MMGSADMAAAPQIVNQVGDGVSRFIGYVTENSALTMLLVILGGIVIVTCTALLVLRKWWPTTTIGQALQGNGTVAWCCAGMLLGLIFILPAQILPFLAKILATLFQIVLNIFASVFGL